MRLVTIKKLRLLKKMKEILTIERMMILIRGLVLTRRTLNLRLQRSIINTRRRP